MELTSLFAQSRAFEVPDAAGLVRQQEIIRSHARHVIHKVLMQRMVVMMKGCNPDWEIRLGVSVEPAKRLVGRM
jgi:hypothetical protein